MDNSTRNNVYRGMLALQDFHWRLPSDFLSYSHYLRIVQKLEWTSSPGSPYNRTFPTNGAMFGVRDGVPNQERVDDIWLQIQERLRTKTYDPIFLFVKPEPLPERKKGRPRLISSVSVVDQIIDHMLFDDFNDNIVSQSFQSSVKVGWTPMLGGWKTVPMQGVSIDKSSWDWTMAHWLFEAILKFKHLTCLTTGADLDRWLILATWRYRALFYDAVFCLPNGWLIQQKMPGVMKSGSVVTIVDNSLAQLILHFRVYSELGWKFDPVLDYIWVCGDDTRQSKPPHLRIYLDYLSTFCRVKDCTERCEFVGCRFSPGGRIEPLYKGKHAYTILHADPTVEVDLAYSYSLLYHRSCDRGNIIKILEPFGPPMTKDFADEIWDGE